MLGVKNACETIGMVGVIRRWAQSCCIVTKQKPYIEFNDKYNLITMGIK